MILPREHVRMKRLDFVYVLNDDRVNGDNLVPFPLIVGMPRNRRAGL